MDAAGLIEYEQVHIYDIDNGNRFSTYAIAGEPGSGVICLNGAAARMVSKGDLVIIACYAAYDEKELADFQPEAGVRGRGEPPDHRPEDRPQNRPQNRDVDEFFRRTGTDIGRGRLHRRAAGR